MSASSFHGMEYMLHALAEPKGVRVEVLHGEHDGFTLKVWKPFAVRRDTPDLGILCLHDPMRAAEVVADTFDEAHRALIAMLRDYVEEHQDRTAHDPGDEDRR